MYVFDLEKHSVVLCLMDVQSITFENDNYENVSNLFQDVKVAVVVVVVFKSFTESSRRSEVFSN